MSVVEAAQEAAVRSDGIEEKGVLNKDAGPRNAPEITLRLALEQHLTQALDPRQRKVSVETAAGYAAMLRLHVPRWLDMPITDITRQMVNEKIKAMSNKPTTASGLLRALGAIYGTQLAYRDDGYEHDPTYRVKGYEARMRELLFDEAKRWPAMDAISKVPNMTRRAAWLALLFTGFRMSSIRALRWQDIDFDEGMLTLGRMKNGLKCTFPLSDAALDVFRLTPRTHDKIVFEGRHYGKSITGLRQIDLEGQDVNNGGVLRPHDTRHQFWVTDITYIRTHEGFLYLAVVIDLFSRRVIGWSMQGRTYADLPLQALLMAVWRRKPKTKVYVHSDQGSQFTGYEWQEFLEQHNLVPSMSRRGNCWDNAVVESFFNLLKRERIRRKKYKTREEARQDVFDYIEFC